MIEKIKIKEDDVKLPLGKQEFVAERQCKDIKLVTFYLNYLYKGKTYSAVM